MYMKCVWLCLGGGGGSTAVSNFGCFSHCLPIFMEEIQCVNATETAAEVVQADSAHLAMCIDTVLPTSL